MIVTRTEFDLINAAKATAFAALVIKPGLSQIVALGYAATFPFYIPLVSGLFTEESSALTIILAQSALQLGALAFGTFGGNSGSGGGKRSRIRSLQIAMVAAQEDNPVFQRKVGRVSQETVWPAKARLKEAGNGT